MINEKEIYATIKEIQKEGKFPTGAEISRKTNTNIATINAIINLLVSQKKITFKQVGQTKILEVVQ